MKEPTVKKLPSGNWHCKLQLGGECISITRRTEAECRAEARYIKAEYLAGKRAKVNKEASEKTLKELQEEFIKSRQAVMSPATVRSYISYKNHRWGAYKDKEYKRIKWQEMINAELDAVSPKTVKNAWGLVSASVKHAGLPVPDVKLAQVPIREIDFLQPEEILKFCETVKGKPYETAALLMLHGLRLSEVLGLTWGNVTKDTIKVQGAMVRGPDGQTVKKTNKNKTSTRTVPVMMPRLSELIAAGKTDQNNDEFIVKIHPSNLLEDVKRGCREAGITETTCHGLRHSYASLMYHLGRENPAISERQVMLWGGWSNIQTMHKIYIRIAAKDETEAVKAAKSFFTETREKQKQRKRKTETTSKRPVE